MATKVHTVSAATGRSANFKTVTDLDESYQVMKAASGAIFRLKLDNTNNTNEHAWLKVYNHATPTVGTTAPEVIVRARKGKAVHVIFAKGQTLATATTIAAVSAGGTGGTSPPTEAVNAEVCIN